ncbi:MAG: hypothetical protein CO094_07340 [Anaerolineae bacterium CG_4_9_14_3_um_filter_57_17]|nr:hypothetical protein [bacterium]OIO87457.1 MAG: hypothetical protein AUK01_00090 [Anaerolineae bacterium CG2_30_57_67]PJB66394.1 MAG: hypothetical protein CO094_07340 [Anaerolineae bacterium CG_4_9_14_3_um_filter_57_17]
MADVKCSMCSASNPAEAEVCQQCGARLKPLTAPLDSIHPGETPTKISTSDLENTLPSWLRDVRQAAEESPAALPAATPEFLAAPVAPTPNTPLDFLSGLSAAKDDSDEPVPDWLAGLRDSLPTEEVSQSQNPVQDLLTSLTPPAPIEPQPVEPPAEEEPTWDFHDSATAETPDWLAALKAQENTPAAPKIEEKAEMSATSGDFPDWLSQLSSQTSPAATLPESAPNTSSSATGDLPDWITSLRDDSAAPVAQPASAEATAPQGDLPDWMASLRDDSAAPVAQPAPAKVTAPQGDLPDWMASLRDDSAAPVEQPAPAEATAPQGDLPDWLANISPNVEQSPSVEKPAKAFDTGAFAESALPGEAEPNWLSGITSSAPQPAAPEAEPASALPGWLDAFFVPGAEKPSEAVNQAAVEMPPVAETLPAETSAAPTGAASDAIFSMDMPDWLAGFTPSDLDMPAPKAEMASTASTETPEITPVNLPSWVQAMRPMEAVIADAEDVENEQMVEKSGPLAGLRAVLPMIVGGMTMRKPKTYSIKLNMDDAQQAQVALLEKLLATETKAQDLPAREKNRAERPLRWVIALILLLVTVIPLLMGSRWLDVPQLAGADLQAFTETLGKIEPNAPVLVVFDYQPALAGELEPIAASAVRELMLKQARLVFVSTTPTGALMSERLMARLDPQQTYTSSAQLGYLPGGAAGIQVFASAPTRIERDGLNGAVLESPTLAGVTTLNDFAAALILTDSPDEGRLWVEQAAPELRGKPLLMVLSAQAEPLLRPYFDSGQVQGLMVGLNSGAVFEQQVSPDGPVRQVWDAFGLGLIAMEALIFIGGIWGLVSAWLSARAAQKQEEA